MEPTDLAAYADPASHEAVSEIIRRHSDNREDLRHAALRDLDLSRVEEALDLGCGYGFMAEEIARRIAARGRVTGVDACPGNEAAFRRKVARAGRQARFECRLLDRELPWPDRSFDLVVASFSLYFFAQIIPAVARVLRSDGSFIVLTHSEGSFLGLLRAVGQPVEHSPLIALVRRFSAENGGGLLARHFAETRRIDYGNKLTFQPQDWTDLLAFLRSKLPLIAPGQSRDGRTVRGFEEKLRRSLSDRGSVMVEKNDAIFVCRRPRLA